MRRWWLICVLCLLPLVVRAQESPAVPMDAAEFLETHPFTIDEATSLEWLDNYADPQIKPDLAIEAFYRYGFSRRIEMAQAMVETLVWHDLLILDDEVDSQYQYENSGRFPIGFGEPNPLTVITASPRDFDGDQRPEWVIKFESTDTTAWWVLKQMGDRVQTIPVELPWAGFDPDMARIRWLRELSFEDLTGDGRPEWVVLVGGLLTTFTERGELFVLQWHQNQIRNIALDPAFSYSVPIPFDEIPPIPNPLVDFSLHDVNGDGINDVRRQETLTNNWHCEWISHKSFVFQSESLELFSAEDIYAPTYGCTVFQAEQAMWEGDFEQAANWYEQALSQSGGDDQQGAGFDQYVLFRAALAYRLNNQPEASGVLVEVLLESPAQHPAITQMAEVLAGEETDPVAMCVSIFHALQRGCADCEGSPLSQPLGLNLTAAEAVPVMSGPYYPQISPLRASCDPAVLLHPQWAVAAIPIEQDPTTWFASHGFEVMEAKSFDLDADGVLEWLVWLKLPIRPIYLNGSEGSQVYHLHEVSFPDVVDYRYVTGKPNPFYVPTSPTVVQSPMPATPLLMTQVYDIDRVREFFGYSRFMACEGMVFTLWREVEITGLEQVNRIAVCDPELFAQWQAGEPLPEIITGYAPAIESGAVWDRARFAWNALEQRYNVIWGWEEDGE